MSDQLSTRIRVPQILQHYHWAQRKCSYIFLFSSVLPTRIGTSGTFQLAPSKRDSTCHSKRHTNNTHPRYTFKSPACSPGSRRPSITSIQSSTSSVRSYSARLWEREREQKERRQMSLRLAQLHDKMSGGREHPKLPPTPSPRSPNNSTDPLLPVLTETREVRLRVRFYF